jgi:hypothetical protein
LSVPGSERAQPTSINRTTARICAGYTSESEGCFTFVL